MNCVFFFQSEDGIRVRTVTGVQTCALPISGAARRRARSRLVVRGGARGEARAAQENRRAVGGAGAALRGSGERDLVRLLRFYPRALQDRAPARDLRGDERGELLGRSGRGNGALVVQARA